MPSTWQRWSAIINTLDYGPGVTHMASIWGAKQDFVSERPPLDLEHPAIRRGLKNTWDPHGHNLVHIMEPNHDVGRGRGTWEHVATTDCPHNIVIAMLVWALTWAHVNDQRADYEKPRACAFTWLHVINERAHHWKPSMLGLGTSVVGRRANECKNLHSAPNLHWPVLLKNLHTPWPGRCGNHGDTAERCARLYKG